MNGIPGVSSGTFADRYTIERELGSGATATVYLARDMQRGRGVAIKVLRPELAASVGADRFLREIKLNEQLQHPHIVPILDSGEHDGLLYFVLPHMEGGSLRQLLQKEKQLPIETALSIAKKLAEALEYAHQLGLIHRDVKPDNILFTSGQACLADFGIARAIERTIEESTTETGLVRGTPAYMSPEQASGNKHYDGRSDQYSLACVLYEMLAGVPAFIGPTPESIIAQRFQHLPRALRVYRPMISAEIEAVVEKALALSPADRYQTSAEFANAIDTAPRTTDTRPAAARPSTFSAKRPVIFGGAVIVALTGAAIYFGGTGGFNSSVATADTTRLVVFPFEASGIAESDAPPHEVLHTSLRRWQGLSLVPLDETAESLRRRRVAGHPTGESARSAAISLGAGRYVVGRIMRTPTGRALMAEYRDVATGHLYNAQLDLPIEPQRVLPVYAALADSLVLRGRTSDALAMNSDRPRNLFAAQAFLRGIAARDDWDLEVADSLFTLAAELDPSFAAAHLWLAQVRVWQVMRKERWSSAAERALADSATLRRVERQMAVAMIAMSEGKYPNACSVYRSLIEADPRSFVGWFGLGECHRRDNAVVADRRSPSGWRFRSSYRQEVIAWTRAFELLPAAHRGFQANAYGRLRELLLTNGRSLRQGVSLDSTRFLARAALIDDTLVLLPHEARHVIAGDPRSAADSRAVAQLRTVFHRIVARWAAAFPGSATAKEGVAVSLELQGDRAGLDSLRAAEALATDPKQRLRLAAWRVVMQVKFAIPDRVGELEAARDVADSLLQAHLDPDDEDSAILAPLAALTGRCSRTARLLTRAVTSASLGTIRIPQDVVADASVLQAYRSLGCSAGQNVAGLDDIARRIVAPGASDMVRRSAEAMLLAWPVSATFPLNAAWVHRLAPNGSYVLKAESEYLSGDRLQAIRTMRSVGRARRPAPGDLTPDGLLPEVLLWLEMGDTLAAVNTVDATLAHVRYYSPLLARQAANNVARMGTLVRSMAMRAQLSGNDSTSSEQWARAVVVLWDQADADLQPLVQELRQLASRR